jgi:regulator of protease activity HflC (stomatin/prohibitin superfamily)
MAWLIIALLLAAGAWVAAGLTRKTFIGIIGTVVAVGMLLFSAVYTQDVGEALVVKNADGTIAREDTTAGMDMKLPWQDTISFDIKGQQALYKGDGKPTSATEQVDGPEITVAGTDKVPVNVDIAIRYSIQPDKVSEIYTIYKTETALFERLISQDIKSVVKDSAASFNVDSLIADRAAYSKAIEDNLKSRWEKQGIVVDTVALQTVRPPQSILDRINASQAAQQQLVQAQADTKVKEEQARQRVIEAKGIADANNTLNGSLTENVLKDKYIQALQNAKSLVVVPNGSTPMVTVPQG